MQFLSLQPFVPSGPDFQKSKKLFIELGFSIAWDAGDYVSLERDGCRFILQKFDRKEFAENFMISVAVDNVQDFREMVLNKKLSEEFGIKVGTLSRQPYGKEVNIIDMAGVCWHFVEG
jgi:hypothetical protein